MTIARFTPFLATSFLLLGFGLVLVQPISLLPVAMTLAVVLGLSAYLVSGQRLWSASFWTVLVTPFWLLVSSLALLMILESSLIRWAVAIGLPLLEGFYLRQLFLYHFQPDQYQAFALENLSGALNVVAIFLAFSSLYGLKLFLGLSWLLLVPLCLSLVGTMVYQTFWAQKMTEGQGLVWMLSVAVLLPELFIALGFLPTSHVVNGLVMSIAFYLLIGLSRLAIRQAHDRRLFGRHVAFSVVLMVLVLISARWM